jgi:hypothetical protein
VQLLFVRVNRNDEQRVGMLRVHLGERTNQDILAFGTIGTADLGDDLPRADLRGTEPALPAYKFVDFVARTYLAGMEAAGIDTRGQEKRLLDAIVFDEGLADQRRGGCHPI